MNELVPLDEALSEHRFDDVPPPSETDDGRQSSESDVAKLPVVSAATLAGIPILPRPWLVRDMIPGRTVTMLSGDGGLGKSTLALQLAVAVAAGRDWLGRTPGNGPVVFLSAEDDLDELHRRLADVAESYGVGLANLGDLHFIPLAGHDAALGAPIGRAGGIKPTPVWRGLNKIVADIKPCLIVLDVLADVFAGNENARPEARQFIGMLRGLAIENELAVLLLSHPSLDGLRSGNGTSGSTAWNNSVRSRLYLESVKGHDGAEIDPDLRALRVMKSNYGPAGLEIRLRWSRGCFEAETPASGFAKVAADANAERVFLDLLAAFCAQGRDVSPNFSNTFAPALFEKHPDAHGIRKREFAAAMERLLTSRRIVSEPVGPQSRRKSRLVICSPRPDT